MSRTSLNGYEFGADPTTEAPFWGDGGDTPSDCYTKTESDARYAQKTQTYTKAEVDEMLSTKANATAVYDKEETYSKSEADDLLAVKANASDVYTKTQTDNLLANKANASNVYTKSQADALLDDKANSADVYTKTQTDNLLGDKANSADVYTKTQTYTKAEVDALVAGGGGGGGVTIDDTTTSTTKTWSSDKIHSDIQEVSNFITGQIVPSITQLNQGLLTLSSNVYTKSETYTKAEVDALVAGGGGGCTSIDDTTTSTTNTWSSSKISTELSNKANTSDLQLLANEITTQIVPVVTQQIPQAIQTLSNNVFSGSSYLASCDARFANPQTAPTDGKNYDLSGISILIDGYAFDISTGIKDVPYSSVKGNDYVTAINTSITPELYKWREILLKVGDITPPSGSGANQGFYLMKVRLALIGTVSVNLNTLTMLHMIIDKYWYNPTSGVTSEISSVSISYSHSESYITLSPSVSPYS